MYHPPCNRCAAVLVIVSQSDSLTRNGSWLHCQENHLQLWLIRTAMSAGPSSKPAAKAAAPCRPKQFRDTSREVSFVLAEPCGGRVQFFGWISWITYGKMGQGFNPHFHGG